MSARLSATILHVLTCKICNSKFEHYSKERVSKKETCDDCLHKKHLKAARMQWWKDGHKPINNMSSFYKEYKGREEYNTPVSKPLLPPNTRNPKLVPVKRPKVKVS
jgi:hypothetical protein